MATNEHVTIDTGFTVLRSGISFRDPSEASCTKYVVLDKAECEAELLRTIGPRAQDDDYDLAHVLTGWDRHYGGPGRSFSEEPKVQVFGTKVLVTQYCGLDV